jgi:hypothetical protein
MWLALCLTSSMASAQSFVIAPPWKQAPGGKERGTEIARIISEEMASQGGEALPPDRASALVEEQYRAECQRGACAERFRAAFNAAAAIVIRVFRMEPGNGPPTSFEIAIQPEPGLEFSSSARFGGAPLQERVTQVFNEALRAYERGAGPWLRIEGAPAGSELFVDDKPVGFSSPLRMSVGTHRVRVSAEGYRPSTRIITLSTPAATETLRFTLERASAAASTHNESAKLLDVPGARRSALWITSGILSAALGAGFVGLSVREQQPCHDVGRAECSNDAQWKTHLGVGVTLSAVSIAALTTGLLLRPGRQKTRVAIGASPHQALFLFRREL